MIYWYYACYLLYDLTDWQRKQNQNGICSFFYCIFFSMVIYFVVFILIWLYLYFRCFCWSTKYCLILALTYLSDFASNPVAYASKFTDKSGRKVFGNSENGSTTYHGSLWYTRWFKACNSLWPKNEFICKCFWWGHF